MELSYNVKALVAEAKESKERGESPLELARRLQEKYFAFCKQLGRVGNISDLQPIYKAAGLISKVSNNYQSAS